MAEIASFMPDGKRGRPQFPVESLQRLHLMQQWFALSDPTVEEVLVHSSRVIAGLDRFLQPPAPAQALGMATSAEAYA